MAGGGKGVCARSDSATLCLCGTRLPGPARMCVCCMLAARLQGDAGCQCGQPLAGLPPLPFPRKLPAHLRRGGLPVLGDLRHEHRGECGSVWRRVGGLGRDADDGMPVPRQETHRAPHQQARHRAPGVCPPPPPPPPTCSCFRSSDAGWWPFPTQPVSLCLQVSVHLV